MGPELLRTDNHFSEQVDKYGDMVYRLGIMYLKNEHDAQDVFQDVFLKLYEKSPEFQDENHQKAWLIKVTVNHCKNVLRAFWRKRTVMFSEFYDTAGNDTAENDTAENDSSENPESNETAYETVYGYEPDEPYISTENENDPQNVSILLSLSIKYRRVLYLHYYEGYSTDEIASMLKINNSTVRTQLKRGRELLKSHLNRKDL